MKPRSDCLIRWKNSKGELNHSPQTLTNEELIYNFLHFLNREEESDSGRVFRPNTISSCRVMDGDIIGEVLRELQKRVS